MSATAAIAVRTWKAGRYTCTLTMQRPMPGSLAIACMEWAPEMPTRMTDDEMLEYRQGRNQALAAISAALGINAAVIKV